MKSLVKSIFRSLGFELRKINPSATPPRMVYKLGDNIMEAALYRLKNIPLNPATIIDLGAAAGTWTLKAKRFFPNSTFVLLEPLEERKAELVALASTHQNLIPVFAAAGAQSGTIKFSVSEDLDGSGVYDEKKGGGSREVKQVTIDQTVTNQKLKGPFILKFDTHGFEVPILEGAKETLQQTDAIIMECYGFRLSQSSLLIHEMIGYMQDLGFRLMDIVDIMRRPGDAMFWQCDLIFLKNTHPVFQQSTYN